MRSSSQFNPNLLIAMKKLTGPIFFSGNSDHFFKNKSLCTRAWINERTP
jgi:hypothetical protein